MTKPNLSRKQRAALERQKKPARYAAIEASTRSSSRSIAHHEASHALMAAYVGLPWKRVEMLPSPRVFWDQGEIWESKPCSRGLVSAAGPAADTLYEHAHPEDGEIHAAGSVEDLMGLQSAAIQALGLEPTRAQQHQGSRLSLLALTQEQSHKVRLFIASMQMTALRWAVATRSYREQVSEMLHERGSLVPTDLNCPPPALTEEALFNHIVAGMVMVSEMPEAPNTGRASHLSRAQMLVSQLAEKAAADPGLARALEEAYTKNG